MARLPAEQEMSGGKSPRQKVWAQIRKQHDRFTQAQIVERGKVSEDAVKDYVKVLLKAGFIAVIDSEPVGTMCKRNVYALIKDNGVEAPRITKKGEVVIQGSVNEAMWGTLRRVLKGQNFDYRELAAFASTNSQTVAEETAKTYVLMLTNAGYLECVTAPVLGRRARPGRYRFKPNMDTGPRAPMIQRTKQVYDPNKNRVMWVEEKGDEDEVM
ncbi:hypothetical protein ACO0K0_07310 [Undibacterium sp. SXout11W]|uniref:hypothetical protein n=1 Tax=Undibacterium sp. SXout11W TaxID=3413050 RepID=UPI003BF0194A